MRKENTEKNIPKYTLLQVFMFSVSCNISSFLNYHCYCQIIFVLYNYDLWKFFKMEINHRSGDREKKNHSDEVNFSECHSAEVISFF